MERALNLNLKNADQESWSFFEIQYRTEYTYNANGELVLKTEKRRVHFFKTIERKTQYFYDSFGNLSKVILPNQKVIEYLIDGQGRRVGKKVDGVLVEGYIYQNQTQIIAVTDGTGIITKRFIYGEKLNSPDVLIQNNKEYRIISDQVGTPRLVVDLSTGRVKEELNFDEFGDDPDIDGRKIVPFGFAGGLYDRDTKLVHFGQREYMPEIGRWISKDKIGFRGGDTNLYAYVGGNPMSYVDPMGLSKEQLDYAFNWLQQHHPELTNGLNPLMVDIKIQGGNTAYTPHPQLIFFDTSQYGSDMAGIIGLLAHELSHAQTGGIIQNVIRGILQPKWHDSLDSLAGKIAVEYNNWVGSQTKPPKEPCP